MALLKRERCNTPTADTGVRDTLSFSMNRIIFRTGFAPL